MEAGIMGRSNATQALLARLRTDILLGVFGNDGVVRELALADKYAASRSSIRNAMLVLETEGLLQTLSNGTKRVLCPSPKDIQDLYDLRHYLEQQAVCQLLARQNRNLVLLFGIMQTIVNMGDACVEDMLTMDLAFHRTVIQCSENKALLNAWDNMANVMRAIFNLNMTESAEYKQWFLSTFVQRHTDLFRALMDDDPATPTLYCDHIHDARIVSDKAAVKRHADTEDVATCDA